MLHFFHWDDFKSFLLEINSECEFSGLTNTTLTGTESDTLCSDGDDIINEGIIPTPEHVVESYLFRPALALLLPDKKRKLLSAQQLAVTDTLLATRFTGCGNSATHDFQKVCDNVHLDVKLSICLQRFAVLHSAREVHITEEKFDINDSSTDALELNSDCQHRRGECVVSRHISRCVGL